MVFRITEVRIVPNSSWATAIAQTICLALTHRCAVPPLPRGEGCFPLISSPLPKGGEPALSAAKGCPAAGAFISRGGPGEGFSRFSLRMSSAPYSANLNDQ